MESKERWQDWAALGLGAWLFVAPFFTPYGSLTGLAAWNAYVVGAAVMISAVWAVWSAEKWQESVNLALGLWLMIAPFPLGFHADLEAAAWSQIVVGVLLVAGAIWALAPRSASGGAPIHHH
ncbi:MAG: hypothetical protein A3G81_02680 [Betaproteobacteria bacterium RIFCSPLOWO2_12_FULL_65_14]|nr:MAG: hypothetical protein A3G81_02680 [Betaproteobacteria bacterium RIFCSPLOWO2_12_FULL_65_14]